MISIDNAVELMIKTICHRPMGGIASV